MYKNTPFCSAAALNKKGFTLIELMIVVAVIAILGAIALPSYQESVARSRRASAQAVLVEASQWLERYYAQGNNYYNASASFASSGLTVSPKSGASIYYNITLTTAAPYQTYDLKATRTGAMSSDPCGDFVLNSVGQSSQTSNSRTDCWAH